MRIELQIVEGCPHADEARARLRRVVEHLAPGTRIDEIGVESDQQAQQLEFLGSPSIRVEGVDLEQRRGPAEGLTCRRYDGDGVPPAWLIEAAVLRALAPRHVLFLCVANSARSQLAEGISRSLAPAHVSVSSAGSQPTRVRPEASAVLAEIGIDISSHRSKAIDEIDASSVEAVITLCAEEVCPALLGRALQVHWGLADPAAVTGAEAERLAAFRAVRDELRRRLAMLWDGPPSA